jgi:hypothetical protein
MLEKWTKEGSIKKKWYTKTWRLLCIRLRECITFHTNSANEAFIYTPLPTASRPKTTSKLLLSKRRDYEEHGEVESPQSLKREDLRMEGMLNRMDLSCT